MKKLQISSPSEIAEAAARWAFWSSYKSTTAADELAPPKRKWDGGDKPPS
ncbi:hypothetical protein [Bradyrhizobium sp. AUGA SZCCT0042]|nr:hypothetical protein [Bradyrhizobium sp. AUGA SZCCT0042]MBR1301881.1 hypothetical protein [Bradyrhizobium sp. AUGA SZCCT0042]